MTSLGGVLLMVLLAAVILVGAKVGNHSRQIRKLEERLAKK